MRECPDCGLAYSGDVDDHVCPAGASWRKARAKAHPDAGGNDGLFVAVQRDAQILAAHHGVASL